MKPLRKIKRRRWMAASFDRPNRTLVEYLLECGHVEQRKGSKYIKSKLRCSQCADEEVPVRQSNRRIAKVMAEWYPEVQA